MAADYTKPKIIAEMASCHNGDMQLAQKMIAAAADVGVDIMKFQSWQSKNVADNDPDKRRYESLELSDEDHYILKKACDRHGVEFLTTCYDSSRIPFLKKLGLKKIKIASTDLKHLNFLKQLRKNFKELIVSTGMSTEQEIRDALEVIKDGEFTMMHCVSMYPVPPEKVNLKKLQWLKTLTPHVGYSDHSQGIEAPVYAIGMGVKYIEKHFTLDRTMPQTPHSMGAGLPTVTTHSIANEPEVFKALCTWRNTYCTMLGTGSLELLPAEKKARQRYTGRLGKNN